MRRLATGLMAAALAAVGTALTAAAPAAAARTVVLRGDGRSILGGAARVC